MKQVLQAKVNILIQKHKEIQESKQKQMLFKAKVKVKPLNSYSLYQEPSKKIDSQQKQHSSNHSLDDADTDLIFKNRFAYFQQKKCQEMTTKQLSQQTFHLNKILASIHQKIDKAMQKAIGDQLSKIEVKNKQKRIKQNKENNTQHNFSTAIRMTSNDDQIKFQHQKQMNRINLKNLKRQFHYLQGQLERYMGKAQDNISIINMEEICTEGNQEIIQLQKIIKQRKKSTKQLKTQIQKNQKYLQKQGTYLPQERSFDTYINIDVENNLKAMFQKNTEKIKAKNQYLSQITKQNQATMIKIEDLEIKIQSLESNAKFFNDSSDSLEKQPEISISTPFSYKAKTTLATTSTSKYANLQQYYVYLSKRKDIIRKGLKSQQAKWKAIYNSKMKRLVNEYCNINDINDIALKLQTDKNNKEEQISALLKRQSIFNESYEQNTIEEQSQYPEYQ